MSHHLRSPLRIAAPIVIVLVALLVPASGAFASTLTSDGTTVTFTADTGAGAQNLGLDEVSANDLTIVTSDDPVAYTDAGGVIDTSGDDCVDADAAPTDGSADQVECPNVDAIVANTNNGDDFVDARGCCFTANGLNTIRLTVNAGIDDDDVFSGDDPAGDTLNGEAGDDDLEGGDGSDGVFGGSGEDDLHGDDGADLLRGGNAHDFLSPGNGADDSDGESGNDSTDDFDDGDIDVARGGDGVDELFYASCNAGCSANDDVHINETGDGATDDGDTEDDPDNDFDGFENISLNVNSDATATVLTTGANDEITGDDEADVFTPRNGVDRLDMRNDNDTANTVDGYADVVNCGNGDDTANADQFDELNDCEHENITQVPSAFDEPDDFPPSVAFSNLNPNQFLPPIGKHLEATASDDNGVVLVVFFDDSERLCDDTTAPYTCEWTQTSDDVGENTLTVLARDTAGQFGLDIQGVEVGKFNADDLSTRATKRDLNGPRRTRVRGMLDLPSGVPSEDGCEGEVRVRILDGSDRIRQRLVPVEADCTYSHRFRLPGVAKLEHENVRIKTKFMGNDVLKKEEGEVVKTKVQEL